MEEPTAKRPRPHQPHHHHNARPKPAHDAATDAARDASLLASNNPFLPMFLTFRAELDEHHDRRERVIKASRDITALSKKMIFSLQRARKLASPLPPHLIKHLSGISADLQALNAHRYQRNISGGLQELIEALAFQHYILTGTLLSYAAAQSLIPGGIELSVADYILGIFDFVGEVMRFGITMIALGGAGEGDGGDAGRILTDLRRLREGTLAMPLSACWGRMWRRRCRS